MRHHKMIVAAVAWLLAAGMARAEEAASFLLIGGGARAAAMGGAAVALSADADAIYWNPAGLASVTRPEAGATHALYLGDTYDALAAAVPLGNRGVLRKEELGSRSGRAAATAYYPAESDMGVVAVGLARMGYAAQEGRDAARRPTGTFSASDYSASLAYARRVGGGFSAGLAVKRAQTRLADSSAGATALDAGGVLDLGTRFSWRFGAAVRNLGQDLRFSEQASPLPLTFAAGASAEPFRGLLLTGEVQRRSKSGTTAGSFGAEYRLHSVVALRAGYLQDRGPSATRWGGPTGGLGLGWGRLRVDYSFAPFGALGTVQTISIGGRF